jgi:hypothetical protein
MRKPRSHFADLTIEVGMSIAQVRPEEVLRRCRHTLGLSEDAESLVDDAFVGELLRRAAGIHCPCSRATLRTAIMESLQHLFSDGSSIADRIDTAVEGLIVGGDLLELTDVTTDDPAVKGTWIFAAPPSYVIRPAGGVFLSGVVPDQDTFLPQSLASRVIYESFTRVIVPKPDEDLAAELREQGLQQLSEIIWLKRPKPERAEEMVSRFQRRVASQPLSGSIKDLQILDPTQSVTYYRGRWTTPGRQSGTFIARRAQEFGAPIWCYAVLEAGMPMRVLDLPGEASRWRACDAAWHLQMAVDHCRKTPQLYRSRRANTGIRVDLFSPLPQWSERRLMIFGRPLPREASLLSYWLPATEADAELSFLREHLWLLPTNDSDQ